MHLTFTYVKDMGEYIILRSWNKQFESYKHAVDPSEG